MKRSAHREDRPYRQPAYLPQDLLDRQERRDDADHAIGRARLLANPRDIAGRAAVS
jgi:hypothetical protein